MTRDEVSWSAFLVPLRDHVYTLLFLLNLTRKIAYRVGTCLFVWFHNKIIKLERSPMTKTLETVCVILYSRSPAHLALLQQNQCRRSFSSGFISPKNCFEVWKMNWIKLYLLMSLVSCMCLMSCTLFFHFVYWEVPFLPSRCTYPESSFSSLKLKLKIPGFLIINHY